MADFTLVIHNGRLRDGSAVDIGMEGDRITAVEPAGTMAAAGGAARTIDAGGKLVSAPLVEPHCHLDGHLTAGDAGHNESGTLLEGIARWAERKKSLTREDVKERAARILNWYVSNGALYVRSHVDVCDPDLTALKALLEVKEEMADVVDLQLVAFPQEGVLSFGGSLDLMEESLKLGCDVVGAIPHYEATRELGVASIEEAFKLAARYNRPIDVHCDETDDEQSRFVEVMAWETIKHGMQGRVTASHTTAMHSYNNAYAFKLFQWLKKAEMSMVSNPLVNITLQGRFDTYPKRRGLTRIKELLDFGINVALGHDNNVDPWYPLGMANMLHPAFMALHVAQMTGHTEIPKVWDMVTENSARVMGIEDDYGIAPGRRADLVIFDAESDREALRTLAHVLYAVKDGRVVVEGEAPRRRLFRDGDGEGEVISYRR